MIIANKLQSGGSGTSIIQSVSIADVAASGDIGTAATTVDLGIEVMVIQNQTTTTKLFTLPTPTNTSLVRKVIWCNSGTARIWTNYQRMILPGGSATFIYVPSVGWRSDSRCLQPITSYGVVQTYPIDTNANDITMITIPGGFLKLNDSVYIRAQMKNTSGANAKTAGFYFGGTAFFTTTTGLATAGSSVCVAKTIQNVNSTSSQKCSPSAAASETGSSGNASTSSPSMSIDTTADVALKARLTKTVGGDDTSLEYFSIQYIPGQTS